MDLTGNGRLEETTTPEYVPELINGTLDIYKDWIVPSTIKWGDE